MKIVEFYMKNVKMRIWKNFGLSNENNFKKFERFLEVDNFLLIRLQTK